MNVHTPTKMQLLSPSFPYDGSIPPQFTCKGKDISPALAWSQPPANTQSFALTMEDPDAPGETFVHWLVYNIPATTAGIPENLPKYPKLPDGTLQGENGFAKIGYGGPCPPLGKEHRYVFKIHALNAKLKCPSGSSSGVLATAMKEHILDTAELVGRYQISQEPEGEPLDPAVQSRLDALDKDPDFKIKTHKLQVDLAKEYAALPNEIKAQVRKFLRADAFSRRPAQIKKSLDGIADRNVRQMLEGYVAYADRYRVFFRIKKTDPLVLETRVWPQFGPIFKATVVGDHLEPPNLGVIPEDDDSLAPRFETNIVPPSEIKKLVDAGKATFFQIDEENGFSTLRQVEDLAYRDNGVAIILHNAEQSYFIVICGAKINKKALSDLGPALTEFQRTHYHESFGGRPRDGKRLKRDLEDEKKPISQKEKAIDAVGIDEKKLNAEQVRLANLREKLRRTKI